VEVAYIAGGSTTNLKYNSATFILFFFILFVALFKIDVRLVVSFLFKVEL